MKYILTILLTVTWLFTLICLAISVITITPLLAFTFLGLLIVITIELNKEMEAL